MSPIQVDTAQAWELLLSLLRVPSPTGYTDSIVHHVVGLLEPLGGQVEVTRRGAIRACIPGRQRDPARAVIAHLDTTGAMVVGLKDNGRLALTPIGHWSSRFAEGARVTVFAEDGPVRGSVLPLKASGHVYNDEVDTQPNAWTQVEARMDLPLASRRDLELAGFQIGDIVAFDSTPEVTESGYVVSRHLDDKAGVTAVIAGARAALGTGRELPVETRLLFTITEETGSGASAVLHGDVSEMVAVDNATPAPGQGSIEAGVTVAMADSTGPFDFHLTRRLLDLARRNDIRHARDVFRFYRCDAAAAIEAGNDLRTALLGIGVDASHGHERTHIDSIVATAELVAAYMLSPTLFERDREALAPLGDFPDQPTPDSPGEPLLPENPPGGTA